jgi:hypothetical protein
MILSASYAAPIKSIGKSQVFIKNDDVAVKEDNLIKNKCI